MVVLGAANVGIALWLNIWNRDFFNALEKRDLAQLFELLWILAVIVVSAGVAVAIQLHVKRRLQVNWRSWLSGITVQRWLNSGRQYQLGLLAEEVDPGSGEMIGNFPQAFSHIGLINAAWAIAQTQERSLPQRHGIQRRDDAGR